MQIIVGDNTFGYSAEQIRTAKQVPIVEVIRNSGLEVKKQGSQYKACCPFHSEKTASFTIHPDKGYYKCFGCGKGGDSVNYIMETERVTFPEAIDFLSSKYNLGLEPNTRGKIDRSREQTQRGLAVLVAAQKYYEMMLLKEIVEGSSIADYLLGSNAGARNLPRAAIKDWHLGYAPEDPQEFTEYILRHVEGANLNDIYGQGLLNASKSSSQQYFPFFQHRIMFPVNDEHGRVVGFSGRVVPQPFSGLSPTHFVYGMGKYMNSRASVVLNNSRNANVEVPTLFNKSRLLYGLDRAAPAIKKANEAIVIEGNFNVISMQLTGFQNVVASLGTAFTTEGATRLSQLAEKIRVFYDKDKAGINASKKNISLIHQAGSVPHIAFLPAGEDPDSIRQKTPNLEDVAKIFSEALYPGLQVVDFIIDAAPDKTTPQGKATIAAEAIDLLWADNDKLRSGFYLVDLAKKLDVPIQLITRGLKDKLSPSSIPRDEFFTQVAIPSGDIAVGFIASLLYLDSFEVKQLMEKIPINNPIMNEDQQYWYRLITDDIFKAGGSELAGSLRRRQAPSEAYVTRAASRQALHRLSDLANRAHKDIPNKLLSQFTSSGKQNPTIIKELFLNEMKLHRQNKAIEKLEELLKSSNTDTILQAMQQAGREWT